MNTLASWGHGGPGPWILLVPLLWAAVIVGVVTVVRRVAWHGRGPWERGGPWDRRPRPVRPDEQSPLAVLGRRFAAGEIDEDEYWRRLSVLDPEFGTHRGEER
ncbi:SHOCT domain-containing protein [Streptomyces sp. PTM05]|uniref:SHOCT domain-containing protein n=1 Tax=Streptantibioticus parmotrematis TaxID=2873249 RepID=A0ABS7QRS7_9ACTN|nr:SHOCT domain-containing protein [Streptantibioticus parmotrematis]MBY8885633.1 SHOCT domain-containing protein [Streptantibioticus parmotrematis]